MAGIAVAYKLFDKTVPNNVVRDAATFDYTLEAYDNAAGEGPLYDETSYRAVSGFGDEVIFRQSLATSACSGEQPPATPYTQPSDDTRFDCNVDSFPGDSRSSMVRITNTNTTPAKAASYSTHVDQSSILVLRYDLDQNNNGVVDPGDVDFDNDGILDEYHIVPTTNPDYSTFLNYWELSVKKQTYWVNPLIGFEYENLGSESGSYAEACPAQPLAAYTAQSPCKLGIIRAAGTEGNAVPPEIAEQDNFLFPPSPTDDREYVFTMKEIDTGADQSAYKGWRVVFNLVFNARISPEPESGRYSTLPVGTVVF